MQFPAMVRDPSHIQNVHIGSLDHPPSYQREPEHLPQGQVVGNEADQSPSVPRLRMTGTVFSFPTCLHGMHEGNFAFIKITTSKNKKHFHVQN